MKRMHVHISVDDLKKNIDFYSALFNTEPTVQKSDYAKWRLEDPMVNFALSTNKGRTIGLNHLGFELESNADLEDMSQCIDENNLEKLEEKNANCCYAKSDKYWTTDPQGIPWENFHTLNGIPMYGDKTEQQCCSGGINSQCC